MAQLDQTGAQVDKKNDNQQFKKRSRHAKRQRNKQPRVEYQPLVKENENLVKFYQAQPLYEEGEFEGFIEGLKETLPASFRINTFDFGQALFLKRLVQGEELHEFLVAKDGPLEGDMKPNKDQLVGDAQDVDKNVTCLVKADNAVTSKPTLEPLCWYPNQLGWQMNLTRVDIRKSPILQQFHKFLMAETDNGFISRQEAVSMIPPLVLDVKKGHNILDMCAAPGSKTAQLLEYLKINIHNPEGSHSDIDKPESSGGALFDDGMVVANDVDNKRCYMLVHQANRLNSPNCIIINEDASRLPNLKTFSKEGELSDLKFDRILCDVPCSGDGTVRKNPDVWRKWSIGNTNNFHGMQVKILKRGLELLKKDGLLVYSTCSMSPVEDEAVVSSVLRSCEGTVKLEDVSRKLPGLKFKPGISKWVIMNKDMKIVPSFDKVPEENITQIFPSQFPPTEEESLKFELDKCARVLPHLQNTGGFFIALFKKVADSLPWEKVTNKNLIEADDAKEGEEKDTKVTRTTANPKKRRFKGFKEDPFHFIESDDPDWISIKSVYGISDDFPHDQLVHRCNEGKKRSIYLVAKRIRNFIIANQEEEGRQDFVKLINGGMRLFSRADTEAGFRICQDGVTEILPFIKDDFKVPITREDLVSLIRTRAVPIDSLSSASQISANIKRGCFILIYVIENEVDGAMKKFETPLVAWKGEKTISLYVSNTYRIHLCAVAQLKITDEGGILEKRDSVSVEATEST